VSAIAQLYVEVADEVVAREPTFRHVPERSAVESRYRSRIGDVEHRLLVAVVEQAVVGFVDAVLVRHTDVGVYQAPGLDIYVEELIVTSSCRRLGVGTSLMDAVEAWAAHVGARIVALDTHVSNETARGLYDALGYRTVGMMLAKDI
jgi:ribosomal protein S18 acetylase RimI-like enzyme